VDPGPASLHPGLHPALKGIDLVVFDKDGTLISFEAMWAGWARRLGARLDLCGVVVEPDAHHDLERLAQRRRGLRVEGARRLNRLQAVGRARDGDPVGQRKEAGEVRDREHPALLQVESLAVRE